MDRQRYCTVLRDISAKSLIIVFMMFIRTFMLMLNMIAVNCLSLCWYYMIILFEVIHFLDFKIYTTSMIKQNRIFHEIVFAFTLVHNCLYSINYFQFILSP